MKNQSLIITFIITGSVLLFCSGALIAQPSAAQLADRLDDLNEDRLSQIDRFTITMIATSGILEGTESTNRYEKVNRDGRDVLVSADEDENELAGIAGHFDGTLAEFVRKASSIVNDDYQGYSVYRIEVNDREFLNSLGDPVDIGEEDLTDQYGIESAVILLDSEDMIMRHASFYQQDDSGENITMNMKLSDFREYAGMPVPHSIEIDVEGLEQMISEDELEEARQAMREMESQLEQMPEAQRRMIEEQLMPQIERFERMIQQGELGNMRFEVKEVLVND